jgi:hypothetical protein
MLWWNWKTRKEISDKHFVGNPYTPACDANQPRQVSSRTDNEGRNDQVVVLAVRCRIRPVERVAIVIDERYNRRPVRLPPQSTSLLTIATWR